MGWMRVRCESVTDVRWAAIGKKLELSPGVVATTVLALAAEAARAKLETGTASVRDFDYFALAAFLDMEDYPLKAITAELARRGLIIDGVFITGSVWAPHVTSTERVRQFRQRCTPGKISAAKTGRNVPDELLSVLITAAKGNVRRDAAGAVLPGIADTSPIERLMQGGADLRLDIVPAITATVAYPGQPSIPTWDLEWIIDEVRRNTQARGLPDPCPTAPRPRNPNLSSSPTRAPS
jgi:hypothetical protein